MTSFRARIASLKPVALLATMFFALALVAHDADARRLGGGKSFGKQSNTFTQRQATTPAPTQQATAPAQTPAGATAPQPSRNRWLGPLAGIAAGLGIAALLSHFGLGGAFADGLGSMILIGLLLAAGFYLWRMLKRSTASPAASPQTEPAYSMATAAPVQKVQPTYSGQQTSVFGTPLSAAASQPAPDLQTPWGVPADFDVAGFLRVAKVQYIRMQAAWDEKNLTDIREFTTPEAFAEIRMQLDDDKDSVNKTEVVTIDAKLLGIETGTTDYLASVHFSGTIRENGQGEAAPFSEVWNLSKPRSGQSGWLLAGIQQTQ
ncbi:MAG: TIM44-like domain-containing protein [Betaproteobacteria bacterium]